MKKDEKIKRLREILPLAWNSYQHLYDVRAKNMENLRNSLLIIISFLSAMSLVFFTYFKRELFFIPLTFQLIAFLILLKAFHQIPFVHWFKLENMIKNINKNKFEIDFISDLKAIEDDTWIYIGFQKTLIKISIFLIISSLYSLVIILLILYLRGNLLYIFLAIIGISGPLLYFYYRKQPKYNYDSNYRKYFNKIKDWFR